jgi:hypothetical protein
MCSDAVSTTIKFLKLTSNNIEGQLMNNSMDLRDIHKYRINDLGELEAAYTEEAELIRNEMETIDDKKSSEYEALMDELNDLKDELDRQQKSVEEITSVREEEIRSENAMLETQNEAIHADIEAYEECRKKNIEEDFAYFSK